MKKTKDIALIILLFSCITSLISSVFKYNFLPQSFFTDAGTIKRFMLENNSLSTFDSYTATAMFYNLLPGGDSVFLVSLLSMLFCIFVAWQVIYTTDSFRNISPTLAIITSIYLILSSIFLAQHSKDLIVLILISIYIFLTKYDKKGLVIFIIFALIYAVLFRAYWLIVIGFFIGALITQRKKFGLTKLLLTCCAMLFALAIMFDIFTGVTLNHYRTSINDIRINRYDANANTIIESYLPSGSIIYEWANAIIAWILLMFPLPLLKLFTFYHTASFLLISTIFTLLFSMKKHISDKQSKTTFILIICFTAVQSIFEPDYGSFLRHITPLLPLFIFIYLKNQESKKIKQD